MLPCHADRTIPGNDRGWQMTGASGAYDLVAAAPLLVHESLKSAGMHRAGRYKPRAVALL